MIDIKLIREDPEGFIYHESSVSEPAFAEKQARVLKEFKVKAAHRKAEFGFVVQGSDTAVAE